MIFTDFEMPVMTGPQMVERIRLADKDVKIVGMTSQEGKEQKKEQIMMDFIIKKPPKIKNIKEII
jgi:CheY-like chemotaxis protein